MRKALLRLLLLALAVVLALLSGIPAANPPVKVYESAAVLAPLCALLAVLCAWGYLLASDRRKRDFITAFSLNLLAVWFLFRALYDVLACYAYYVTG